MKHGIELYGAQYRDAVEHAREFRQAPTRSEAMPWHALRAKRRAGLKFRRQNPVGPILLDFYCPEYRLAVDVVGPLHDWHSRREQIRQRLIEECGIHFAPLTSSEVENDLGGSLLMIRCATSAYCESSHPCSAGGAGAGG